uniref:Uncharacterized protein n=1 Tax=Arundo donax TaxID=35708 RepID=A0A0A8YAE4_ARUDO
MVRGWEEEEATVGEESRLSGRLSRE